MGQSKAAVGSKLIDEVATLSGLPVGNVTDEIHMRLHEVGCDPQHATLDDLRRAMAAFLAEMMGEYCDIDSQEI